MSKRLAAKLAVMVATLGAVTLLQGCGGDNDGVNWTFVYMPVIPGSAFATMGYATGDMSGGGGGVQSGGATTASASATAGAARGGGGGQVSGGGM